VKAALLDLGRRAWRFRLAVGAMAGTGWSAGMALTATSRVEGLLWLLLALVLDFAFAWDVLMQYGLGGWDAAVSTMTKAADVLQTVTDGTPFTDDQGRIWRCADPALDERVQRYRQIVDSQGAEHLVRMVFRLNEWMQDGAVVLHRGHRWHFVLREDTDRHELVAEVDESAPQAVVATTGESAC